MWRRSLKHLSDRNPAVAASARARYSGASIYAGGRERLSIPQQNTRRSNAPVEPHRASAGIFSKTWGENNVTIHPWWPRWTTASAQRKKPRPAHPRTPRGENNHFCGTFSEFSRTVEGLWRTCEDIYLPSGRRCGVPIRFFWMIPCSQSRAVRSFSSRRYLTEGSRKKAITETEAAGPPLRALSTW